MISKIKIGFSKSFQNEFSQFRKTGFALIADEIPHIPRARELDLTRHSIDLLRGITPARARQLAESFYTMTPGGETTLTVRNGRIALQEAFLHSTQLDKLRTDSEEALLMVRDILFNPLVHSVLCSHNRNGFDLDGSGNGSLTEPDPVVLIRLNRAELGDKDALILGLSFINLYPGLIIVPDGGFYLRDTHANLIHQDRLIFGVNHLAELPLHLRNTALFLEDKEAHQALYEDAELLARFAGKIPGTVAFSDFIDAAMAPPRL